MVSINEKVEGLIADSLTDLSKFTGFGLNGSMHDNFMTVPQADSLGGHSMAKPVPNARRA